MECRESVGVRLASHTFGQIARSMPDSTTHFVYHTPPRGADAASIWDESRIGIPCAKVCPPDERRVAVGSDDAVVRVWVMPNAANVVETAQVFLGHKNGFSVLAVDWNRDGQFFAKCWR